MNILKPQQGKTNPFVPFDKNFDYAEEDYVTPELSSGSPLLNKNQSSLDYQSLCTYINNNFDTCNHLGLDHRFSGLKRQLDFTENTPSPQTSMDFTSASITNESGNKQFSSMYKKIKYNQNEMDEMDEPANDAQLEKDRSSEYVQLPKMSRIFSYRHLDMNTSKEAKREICFKFQKRDTSKDIFQQLEPKKRVCDFEELSQASTDAESSPFLKESIELKRFRSNNYQIQEQTFSFPLH